MPRANFNMHWNEKGVLVWAVDKRLDTDLSLFSMLVFLIPLGFVNGLVSETCLRAS